MVKITTYSEVAVQQLYESLQHKIAVGITVDYEVHLDYEKAVPRTDKLENFFLFRQVMGQQTERIEVWLFKGTSRRYDKHVFELPKARTPEELLKEQTDELRRKLAQEWQQRQLVAELKACKEKCKELKEEKKELKSRVADLEAEAKNTGIMNGLVDVLKQSGFMIKSENSAQLSGVPVQPLIEKLSEMEKKMGDEAFQYFLGTAFMLGQHPKIIPDVRKLIEQLTDSRS